MATAWTCPFCSRPTTITGNDTSDDTSVLAIRNKHGEKILSTSWIVCPNDKCKEYVLTAKLWDYRLNVRTQRYEADKFIKKINIIPASIAKAFPDYIPEAIRQDYEEAYLIKDLSPKASATLSRRCLQGMIRDFWKIEKDTLKQEIDSLKGKVDLEVWEAIDAVRSVGNIGAHMEKDINVIIDVDPEEAELLLKLIEDLLTEWYVRRAERKAMFGEIIGLKEAKQAAKAAGSVGTVSQ